MISATAPIYKEEDNIQNLYERLFKELEKTGIQFKINLVNDGSSDNSAQIMESLAKEDKRLKIVNYRRNYGQSAAMMARIDYASGDIIIPMDGDLQNDPSDISKFLTPVL